MDFTQALCFDDVLIKPRYSDISSRKEIDTEVDLGGGVILGLPIISSPMDTVTEASLRCVAGSHLWDKPVLPTRWLSETNFYPDDNKYMQVPDPDLEGMDIKEWDMEPGDAVAFNYGILHGARGNTTNKRRRAFSLRLLGDDARYIDRPGPTSPPFPSHEMKAGDKIRNDWFPVIYEEN